ncbi:F-box protein pof6 [Neolecta irregularis DAH-3]|uniref:F-box protein pof6 n=1 Tax=Neolecta irregularis (strain DAH-3) TaxID=1198029 RepID=A0A1U7LVS4_NEOID|nr:F-box protein pof6 [Neolecta irregularis DAH-3]|eukprot:OLL26673.1 F-box protein pof6 [Neolecta irregularis DAH-3]
MTPDWETLQFEHAALQQFTEAYRRGDIHGQMKRAAAVLVNLDGGQSIAKVFLQINPLNKFDRFDPLLCLTFDAVSIDAVAIDAASRDAGSRAPSLQPMLDFVDRAVKEIAKQVDIVHAVFPPSLNALSLLFDRFLKAVLQPYLATLIAHAAPLDTPLYLHIVVACFQQSMRIHNAFVDSPAASRTFKKHVKSSIAALFAPGLDHYLQKELDYFCARCKDQIDSWDKKIELEAAATESLLYNANHDVVKRNFLASFKKAILTPVSILAPVNLPSASPPTELAAQTEILNARLEGIKSLFSLEIALNIVNAGREALDRANHFITLDGPVAARTMIKCEEIFTTLLDMLGNRHIKVGFDKAIQHMLLYSSNDSSHHYAVQPLVRFLELVHIGDLIQQMIDLFYQQEMKHLIDCNDFLNPAVKEKKKFEQLIDERVATGLNRGIDVLITQVQVLLTTLQLPSDYNPTCININLEATPAAKASVECLTTHTKILVGSTDKYTLDVFFQEVGIRLFQSICKHIKRQTISYQGALRLNSDLALYHSFAMSLRQKGLTPYFDALKELGILFLIDASDSTTLAGVVDDSLRFGGVFTPDDLYEFVTKRADWIHVAKDVDKAVFGMRPGDCLIC